MFLQEFFDHWLRLHCRPLGQAAPEEDEDDPAALGPNGLPQVHLLKISTCKESQIQDHKIH